MQAFPISEDYERESSSFCKVCQVPLPERSHYKVTIPFSEGNGVSLSPGPYDSLGLMDIGAGRISDEKYQNGGKCQANLWEFMGK
jgi:hypothetical protein